MEFSTFSFRNLGLISPVRLRETGKNWGYAVLAPHAPSIPGYQRDSVGAPVVELDLNRGLRARLPTLIRGENWP